MTHGEAHEKADAVQQQRSRLFIARMLAMKLQERARY
jgi:hypothetical protein